MKSTPMFIYEKQQKYRKSQQKKSRMKKATKGCEIIENGYTCSSNTIQSVGRDGARGTPEAFGWVLN